METPTNTLNITTQNKGNSQKGNSGVQDLLVKHSTPILMGGGNGATTFCTTAGVSNSNAKKIILQPLAQQSNIILTSGGQPILLQATTPGIKKYTRSLLLLEILILYVSI